MLVYIVYKSIICEYRASLNCHSTLIHLTYLDYSQLVLLIQEC